MTRDELEAMWRKACAGQIDWGELFDITEMFYNRIGELDARMHGLESERCEALGDRESAMANAEAAEKRAATLLRLCVCVFGDFDEKEIRAETASVRRIWERGRDESAPKETL